MYFLVVLLINLRKVKMEEDNELDKLNYIDWFMVVILIPLMIIVSILFLIIRDIISIFFGIKIS